MRNIDTRIVAFVAVVLVACSTPEREPHVHDVAVAETTLAQFPATSRLELASGGRVGIRVAFQGAVPTIEVRTGTSSEWLVPTVRWSERDSLGTMHWVMTLDAESAGNTTRRAELRATASGRTEIAWSIARFEGEANTVEPPAEIAPSRNALRADLSAMGVVSRATWRASPPTCSTPEAGKSRFAIHHTDGATLGDAEARMRSIQQFHMVTRGWCDIGYHFLVAYDGRVFEGRELDSLGAHVGAENPNNVGISFIGCFDPDLSRCAAGLAPNRPSDISLASAANVIRVITAAYGFRATRTNTRGHREHAGAATTCPGDTLLSLIPTILAQADGTRLDSGVDARIPDASADARIPDAGADARSRDAMADANVDANAQRDASRAVDARAQDVRAADARRIGDANSDATLSDGQLARAPDVPSLRFATSATNPNVASAIDAQVRTDAVSPDPAATLVGNGGGCGVHRTAPASAPASLAILSLLGVALLRVGHERRIRRSGNHR